MPFIMYIVIITWCCYVFGFRVESVEVVHNQEGGMVDFALAEYDACACARSSSIFFDTAYACVHGHALLQVFRFT